MKTALAKTILATTAGLLMTGTALAQTATATATTDLNIRSGPGPQFETVGVIASGDSATVTGCVADSMWCEIDYGGTMGYAYSDYLTVEAEAQGEVIVLTERPPELVGVAEPSTTANSTVTGAAGGAIAGALIGGPVGAAIGAGLGATTGVVVDPPESARTYVTSNPMEPVYLEGEVVVGAQVPDTVTVQPIPDYDYEYVYINGQPVLVDPANREIVHIFR
ncbi:DUF1236 domain-containing protein [Pelagibacterium halotolerans]|uniref:SH3b domain-containing protein n=1 Tax=Pelagibacterium halotolerans (strain DSM 22347 / JCM 15775 / CGMCC 1.7692 / B2) TaxID=1082931 RepID=G4R8N7_PELHB|nr:DUF1236 domain-containing protein [Pelagibacterium halotolerans]AEQ50323.1 hypothetical protein KKY_278 [Pelagibacterium halotolerans B2]QJR19691.1 DUF1236 domain-containing protein [Pelagibacterium halotolerans]SEA53494.1 SH3 domain-containing protein [Pelagibacterium halotolerans]